MVIYYFLRFGEMMSRIIFIFLIFSCSTIVFSQSKSSSGKLQRGTANYYLKNPEAYEGKSLTIYILQAQAFDSAKAPDGYVSFIANTSSNNGAVIDGGTILIYVRKGSASGFAKRFKEGWIINGKPAVQGVSGKFLKSEDGKTWAIKMN